MSLQKFEGSYRFSRVSDQEGLCSCTICNKPNILIDEFYFHVKTHLNEQHESDMNSLAQKRNTSRAAFVTRLYLTQPVQQWI